MSPARNEELRKAAADAYAASGTVRGTAERIERSIGWTHALLVEIGILGHPDSRTAAQRRRREREAEDPAR